MVNKNLIELDSHYLVSQVNSIKFYSGFNLRENDSHALNENKNNLILCKNLQQDSYKTGMASNKITARKRSDYKAFSRFPANSFGRFSNILLQPDFHFVNKFFA